MAVTVKLSDSDASALARLLDRVADVLADNSATHRDTKTHLTVTSGLVFKDTEQLARDIASAVRVAKRASAKEG